MLENGDQLQSWSVAISLPLEFDIGCTEIHNALSMHCDFKMGRNGVMLFVVWQLCCKCRPRSEPIIDL